MAKQRGKPKAPPLPPQGNIGPDTPAQRAGTEVLTIVEPNGAKFRRKRRMHALEIMANRGKINARQCAAGIRLHEELCKTEKSSPSAFTRCFVDTSPDHAALILALAERSAGFGELYHVVPKALRGPVNHCVLLGLQLRAGNEYTPPYSRDGKDAKSHCAMLQVALDLLANHLCI